jgi:hypothetical protein
LAEIGRDCDQRAGSGNEGDGAEHGHDESPLANWG